MITITVPENSAAGKALHTLAAAAQVDPSTIASLLLEITCSARKKPLTAPAATPAPATTTPTK